MSVYGLGGVLSKLLQFLLLPLYTRFLSLSDYGSLEIVFMSGSVLGMLFGFLISSGFVRYYYERDEEGYHDELLSSAVWFTVSISLPLMVLCFLYSRDIAVILFDSGAAGVYLRLIAVSTFLVALNQIFYNLLMVRERARRYVTLNIMTLLVSIVFAIVFVAGFGWAVRGVLLAQVIGFSAEFIFLLLSVPVRNILNMSFARIGEMLTYSLPLIPLQISSFVLELSDRYFLKAYRGFDDVGIYALGYKFAAVVPLLAIQPLKGFTPYIYSLISTPEKCKQTLADFFRYYLAGVLSLALVISVFSREVIMVMADASYHSGWTVVFVLCLSYVFYSMVNLASYAIEIVRKNWISGIFWVFAATINVFLNILLIPPLGGMGAAVATTLSYLLILFCYFFAVKHVYYVPFEYGKIFLLTLLTSLFYYLSTFLHFAVIFSVPAKIILVLIYLVVIFKSGYFTSDEILRVRSFAIGSLKKAA